MKKIITALALTASMIAGASAGIIDESNQLIIKNKVMDKMLIPSYGNYYLCTGKLCIEFEDVQKLLAEKGVRTKDDQEDTKEMLCYYNHELVSFGDK